MKTKLVVLFISIISIGILTKCGCHSCLAGGEIFDLPYSNNQTVTFINDAQVKKEFIACTSQYLPEDEYCGHVGSESYGKCSGEAMASLTTNNESNPFIYISFRTNNGDDVEQHINKFISVSQNSLTIYKGVVSTNNPNAVVKLVENITINGNQYSNVYVYQNDLAAVNSCSYFVYSLSSGILQYTIKLENSSENWVLAN